MAYRRERCNQCMVQLMVPPDLQTFQCPSCRTLTRVRHNDPMAQATAGLILSHAAAKYNKFMKNRPGLVKYGIYGYNYPQPPQAPYQPPQPPRVLPCPAAYGRKRAILCGMSYKGRQFRLNGGVNDVMSMRYFLTEKLGFPADSILILTEEERDPLRIPTKQNIRMALKWLVQGCQSGDSLVFHYSGHGAREKDYSMDETDGYDEALCPVDFETEGKLIDDEINHTIVRPLPHGAILHAIIDSCYSGTILDLPFACQMNQEGMYMWEDQRVRSSVYKGTNGGLALCFSACEDDQTSSDTTAFSETMSGAMTYSFIKAAQTEFGMTYGGLLNAMRSIIRHAQSANGSVSNASISSSRNKFLGTSQGPQLSSSEKFDIYSKKFIL